MPHVLVSASQISTFVDCKRKWAWDKLNDIKAPSSAAALRGGQVHLELEALFRDGVHLNFVKGEGELISRGLHLYPLPIGPYPKPWKFEHAFDFSPGMDTPYRLTGLIDMYKPGDVPQIWDHKTTSNIQRWGKSAEVLKADPQAVIYAAWALGVHGAGDRAEMNWVYHQTTGRRSAKVSMELTRVQVAEQMAHIDSVAMQIVETRAAYPEGRAIDVEPTLTACDKYGGCTYKELCGLKLTYPKKGAIMVENKETEAAPPPFKFVKLGRGPTPLPVVEDIPVPEGATEPAEEFAPAHADATDETVPPPSVRKATPAPQGGKFKPVKKRAVKLPEPPPEPATVDEREPLPPVNAPLVAPVHNMLVGYTLYIGCLPHGVAVTYVSELIALASIRLSKELGGTDYRLHEAGAYGRSTALLQRAVLQELNGYEIEHLVMNSAEDKEAMSVLPVLQNKAGRVVQRV